MAIGIHETTLDAHLAGAGSRPDLPDRDVALDVRFYREGSGAVEPAPAALARS